MQFDAALAAQETFRRAEAELGSDWDTAVELEDKFSSYPLPQIKHLQKKVSRNMPD